MPGGQGMRHARRMPPTGKGITMGKKPLYGALGLVWVGLALGSISGVGCMGDGQKKYPAGNIRPVQPAQPARPPAQFNQQTPAGTNDLNKLPPLNGVGSTTPPTGIGGPASEYSKFGGTPTNPTPKNGGGLQQMGGFEQGGKMPTGTLPGNTSPAIGTTEGKDKSSLNALPPNPTIANTPAGTQTTNFGGDPAAARPIATGGMVLPPPPSPGRDALGGTGIPGAPPPNTGNPTNTLPGTPVGTSSNYGGSRTTAPPTTEPYVVPGGQGQANFDPLPPLGPRNP